MQAAHWARSCRNLAAALPELAGSLQAMEIRFLRDAVAAQEDGPRRRPLELVRLEVVTWENLLADIMSAARNRELGQAVEFGELQTRLGQLVSDLEFQGEPVRSEVVPARLRQATALATPAPTGLTTLPAWMDRLGDRNLRTWQPKRLRQALTRVEQNGRIAHTLEEMVLIEFIGTLGHWHALQCFLMESGPCWRCSPGDRKMFSNLIWAHVRRLELVGEAVAEVLVNNPRIWRDLQASGRAAQALVDAVISICEVIRILHEEEVIFPESNSWFLAMRAEVERAENACKEMREEVTTSFPGRIDFGKLHDPSYFMSNLSEIYFKLKAYEISLKPKLTFWEKIRDFLDSSGGRADDYFSQIFDWHAELAARRR